MNGLKGGVVATLALWIAAACQLSLSNRLSIGPGAPDFPLVVVACLGLFCDRRGATLLGFGAGLMQGVVTGANLTLYVTSRAIAGFLLGCFNMLGAEANVPLAFIVSVVLTLLAQLIVMFMGIRHGALLPYLEGTLVTAVYNGVLAVPVYALLKRFLSPPDQ